MLQLHGECYFRFIFIYFDFKYFFMLPLTVLQTEPGGPELLQQGRTSLLQESRALNRRPDDFVRLQGSRTLTNTNNYLSQSSDYLDMGARSQLVSNAYYCNCQSE